MKQRFSTDLSALVQGVLQQNMVKAVVLRGATLMGGPNKGLNCTKTVSEKAQSSQLVAFFVASCSGSFREIPSLVLSLVIVERRACVLHEARFTNVSIFNEANPVMSEAAVCQCAFLIQTQCFC